MAVQQSQWQSGTYGNWGEKLGSAIANSSTEKNAPDRVVGYDDPVNQESVELGPNEMVPEGMNAIMASDSNAPAKKFGFGNLGNSNIFSTIDKVLNTSQDYVNQNMPGFQSGQGGNNMGITKYKNGEIVNGNGNGQRTSQSGGTFNIPRVMTPLVSSLHKNLTDDKGIFQGGREGRVFGRLKDFTSDAFNVLTGKNRKPAFMRTEQTHGSSYLTSPQEAAANAGQTTPQFDIENNEEVANVQNMLIDLGYLSGDAEAGEGADGMFGKNTEAAWQAYTNDRRQHQGLDPYTYDGVTDGTQNYDTETDYSGESYMEDNNLDPYGYGTEMESGENIKNQTQPKGNFGAMEAGQWYEWVDENGNVQQFNWGEGPAGPAQLQQMNSNQFNSVPY